jgi:hypothetical protein
MTPPTKLPNGRATSDHRWPTASLVTTRSKPPDPQPITLAKLPLDAHGSSSTLPLTGSPWPQRSPMPCSSNAIASPADLESP